MVKPHFHVKIKVIRWDGLRKVKGYHPSGTKVLSCKHWAQRQPHFVLPLAEKKPPLGGRYGR